MKLALMEQPARARESLRQRKGYQRGVREQDNILASVNREQIAASFLAAMRVFAYVLRREKNDG
jgi:hypothetical protein